MEIIEENPTNWLVLTPDGSTETKTKSSKLNKLLYGYDLFGLIDRGDEIWKKQGREDEPSVTIIPQEGNRYVLNISNAPRLTLGAHHKSELIDRLAEVMEDHEGESVQPLIDLYDSIRGDMIRDYVLSPFANAFSEKVEERDDGWFIHDHLLLTFEGEFFHPNTDSKRRSGNGVVPAGSNNEAYSVRIGEPEKDISREIEIGGEPHRLTDKEVTFLAKALWALKNAPDRW